MTLIEQFHNNRKMKTKEELAQWVVDSRDPKTGFVKVSDSELYNTIVESIEKIVWEKKNEVRQETKAADNEPWLIQGNNDFPPNNTYVEPWESMGK